MDRETPLAEIRAEARTMKRSFGSNAVSKEERNNSVVASSPVTASVSHETIEPTEEQLATLPRHPDRLPIAAWLVAVVELCERFTYYGVNAPFQNYMQNPRHDPSGIPGALGLGQAGATGLSYFFQFFCYLTPIAGAIIADQYFGKYKTICLFAAVYLLGLLILFTTSLPVSINHGSALGGLVAAMIVIGLGTGGIKANVSPLIAEQYTNTQRYVRTLKSGAQVIIDPALTIQRIFMFFYACINLGSLSAIATTNIELHVDFWAAFLLPFCMFFIAILVLFIGRKKYVNRPPRGSIIPDCFRALWIAARHKNLDAAKGNPRWTDNFIDELRRALVACRIFLFYPIYWVCYGQMLNNFVSQAAQMELHGIPNDIMQNIDPLAILLFIPILDYFVYPAMRRVGIRFLPITRIFFGFLFAALAMAYAAIVQHLIYTRGPCYDHPLAETCLGGAVPNRIHVAVQSPAYALTGLSEIFASITGLEYAFSKAPPSMKSFIMSIFLSTNAIGAALGIALSPTAKNPKLVWMYTGLSITTALFAVAFWIFFRKYNQTEDEMNELESLDVPHLQGAVANGREKPREANLSPAGTDKV